jgi:hypothetical protein
LKREKEVKANETKGVEMSDQAKGLKPIAKPLYTILRGPPFPWGET